MTALHRADLRNFFLLVLLGSLPFYAIGWFGGRLPLLSALPVSALGAVVPGAVALLLASRRGNAGTLLRRSIDPRGVTGAGWAAALGIMPVAAGLNWLGVWLLRGSQGPLIWVGPGEALLMIGLLGLGALAEELGWQAYAYPLMRGPALRAALVLGAVWALWHLVPFLLMGRAPGWVLWHSLSIVAMRVVIVWLVVNAGQAVVLAVVLHLMSNAVWGLTRNYDAYYAPEWAFAALALLAAGIVVRHGPGLSPADPRAS